MRTPEKVEKDKIRAYLKTLGCYAFAPVQQGFGEMTVDLLCCIRGTFWAIEVKRDNETRPTARQFRALGQVRQAGGMAAWGNAERVLGEIRQWLNFTTTRRTTS
jgi:hypothetical protein